MPCRSGDSVTISPAAAIQTARLVLVVALVLTALHYRALYLATDKALEAAGAAMELQQAAADEKLRRMTVERDKRQAALDAAAQQQEVQDAAAIAHINRLQSELDSRPVWVRIVPEAGGCGGSPAGGYPGAADAGAGNAAESTGLLPEANSRRLTAALKEVETLSAAYASCRRALINNTMQGE